MTRTQVAWHKTVALALALGVLAQPLPSGVRLASQANATGLTAGGSGYPTVRSAQQFPETGDPQGPLGGPGGRRLPGPETSVVLAAAGPPVLPAPLPIPGVPIVPGASAGYLPGAGE